MTPHPYKHKRINNRGCRAIKPSRPQKPGTVGNDFLRVLDECKALLEKACEPSMGGRPRKSFARDNS